MTSEDFTKFGFRKADRGKAPGDQQWFHFEATEGTQVIELRRGDGGAEYLLTVRHGTPDLIIEWAAATWAMSDAQGGDVHWNIVLCGTGPSGNLRELRHTYFIADGEVDGYVFCIDPEFLNWVFTHLKQWFDL